MSPQTFNNTSYLVNRFFLASFYLLFICFFPSCIPVEVVQTDFLELPEGDARYPRILGAQVTLFESKDYEAFGKSLDQMSASGVNTLFFRVFQNSGDRRQGFVKSKVKMGVYFETDQAPVVEDLLGQVCSMAHSRGMRVFAWMTTRRSDWLIQKRPDLAGWKFDPEREDVVRTPGLDLFHPEVVGYLQNIFSDLAQYPIDGILFQDDLVLRHTEGFGPEAERRYHTRFGSRLSPESFFFLEDERIRYRPEFWAWVKWKNRIILEVIDSIAEAVSESRPDLYWVLNGYYESVTDPEHGLAWYAQDLTEALSHRIDYIAVMAYHRQIMEELQIPYKEVLGILTSMTRDVIAMTGDPDRVLMKVQTLDWHTERPLPAYEIRQVFHAVLAGGSPGMVYVRGKYPPPLGPVREAFVR